MDVLEQPLEAVALHIYFLPELAAAGAAAWTCLAAVLAAAAAAGLWRLRSSAPHVIVEGEKPLESERSPAPSVSLPEPERPSESPAPSPRERYTAYYYDSGCVGCCDVEGDDDDEEEEEDEVDRDLEDGEVGVHGPSSGTDPFGFEVMRSLPGLMTKTAAAETGRYRNATALSGSVVRLWDQSSTPAASPRRRGRALSGTISAF